MSTRKASCGCGQLSVMVTGAPVRISVCHCLACQRRTGSVFGMQARWLRPNVEVRGTSTAYAQVADSGNRITFHFCPVCGATVHYGIEGDEDLIAVAVGAFADPGFPPPAFSVYEERKHAWVSIPGAVEHSD